MEREHLPLLALSLAPSEVGETEQDVIDGRDRAIRQAEQQLRLTYRKADKRLASKTKKNHLKAGTRIAELKIEEALVARLQLLQAQGPPPNAPPGGRWIDRKFQKPTTVLCCVPWSESARQFAYRTPDRLMWDEIGVRIMG